VLDDLRPLRFALHRAVACVSPAVRRSAVNILRVIRGRAYGDWMRIISDSPLDVLRAAARAHLGAPVWTSRDQLGLFDPSTRIQRPIERVFCDRECTQAIDPRRLTSKRILLKCDQGVVHTICAELSDGPPNSSIFLSVDFMPLIVVQTDAAQLADGTIQIHGHERGMTVLTAERVIAQRDRTLQRGDGLYAYTMEVQDATGAWKPATLAFAVPPDLIKSITE
jgi:hypothetical protein